MTTFAEIKSRIIRLAASDVLLTEDPTPVTYGADYSAEMLADAVYAALDAILPWVWRPATDAIAASATNHQLPADLVSVEAVWDTSTSKYLSSGVLAPGEIEATMAGNSWIMYPSGYITFGNEIGEDGGILYYSAIWDQPVNESDDLASPLYSHLGVVYYGAMYALVRRSVEAAAIRQFGSKIDSGTPEHNPLRDMAVHLNKLFDIEMSKMPAMLRGVK